MNSVCLRSELDDSVYFFKFDLPRIKEQIMSPVASLQALVAKCVTALAVRRPSFSDLIRNFVALCLQRGCFADPERPPEAALGRGRRERSRLVSCLLAHSCDVSSAQALERLCQIALT
jgi:hypothetical protein